MSNKPSERSEMSDAAQAAALVKGVVTVDAGATVKARIGAAARRLGWPYSRTRDAWYEQARRIDAREMDALRAAKRAREIEEARRDYQELDARLARIEAALAVAYPTLDREALDMVRQTVRGPRQMADAGGAARRLTGERGEVDR